GAIGEQLALGPLAERAVGTEHDGRGDQAEAEFVRESEAGKRAFHTGVDLMRIGIELRICAHVMSTWLTMVSVEGPASSAARPRRSQRKCHSNFPDRASRAPVRWTIRPVALVMSARRRYGPFAGPLPAHRTLPGESGSKTLAVPACGGCRPGSHSRAQPRSRP